MILLTFCYFNKVLFSDKKKTEFFVSLFYSNFEFKKVLIYDMIDHNLISSLTHPSPSEARTRSIRRVVLSTVNLFEILA